MSATVQSNATFNSPNYTFNSLYITFNGFIIDKAAEKEKKRTTRVQDYLGVGTPLMYK